jgi:hypothetical protein
MSSTALWTRLSGNGSTSDNPSTTRSKRTSHADPHPHTLADSRRQPPPSLGPTSLVLGNGNADSTLNDDLAPRRPLLPHIYYDLPLSSHSIPTSRRSRSTGQDADPSPLQTAPLTRKTRVQILVIEYIQESWGYARYAYCCYDEAENP